MTAALRALAEGRRARLDASTPAEPARDGFGRLLAHVFPADVPGLHVNVEMVRQGWAPYWTEYDAAGRREVDQPKTEIRGPSKAILRFDPHFG